MKKIIISAIAIFSILGLSFAYADEFRMPFDPDNLIDHWLEVALNPTDDGGVDVTVTHTSLFHFANLFEVPDQITVQVLDNNDSIVASSSMAIKPAVEKIIEPEPEPTTAEELGISEETMAKLDEKRAEIEKIASEALTCVLGIEGSSIFTEYRELQVLKQMTYFKQLPLLYQERQIILWTEECRVWSESYLGQYRQYQDIFKEEQRTPAYSKVLDDTDSPITDPLTEEDFLKEIEEAEQFMCSAEGKARGLCIKEFEGINRGGYSGGLACVTQLGKVMCPLIAYNTLIASAISEQSNYSVIQDLVCEKFLNQYSALVDRIKAGDETAELPNWLAHCEVE